MAHCCRALTRSIRPARARRGGPRAAGDRAGHADAGRHRARPAHVRRPRASASRWPSTAARRCGRELFDEGIAAAAAAAPQRKVLVSVFLDGGADALSLLAPTGDPLYRQLRPRLGAARRRRHGVRRGPDACSWHPSLAPLAELHGEGKVSVMPGDRLRPPEPVALHLAALLGGRSRRRAARRPAGSAATSTGSAARTTRSRASRSTGACSRRSPRRRCRSPPSTRPTATTSGRAASGARSSRADGRHDRQARRASDPRRSRPRGGEPMQPASRPGSTSSSLRSGPKDDKKPPPGPVAYPESDDAFPRRLAGLAAMLAAGLPLHVVALSAPGGYDTHDNQAPDLADDLKLTADSLLAFQRDLEARGLADRVLVHVWSEFGRRAKENGSGGTDHGAAGTGFLIGSRVAGTMIGEFPGLARLDARRQPPRHGRLPRALRRAARGLARRRRRRDHPGRAEVPAADDPAMRRPLAARGARRCSARRRSARRRRRPTPGAGAGVRRRVHARALARVDPPRPGDRRARQLRRGRPRPRAAPGRRHAHLPDRARASRARRASSTRACAPAATPLWCTLADHRARGMRATLRVRPSALLTAPAPFVSCDRRRRRATAAA